MRARVMGLAIPEWRRKRSVDRQKDRGGETISFDRVAGGLQEMARRRAPGRAPIAGGGSRWFDGRNFSGGRTSL